MIIYNKAQGDQMKVPWAALILSFPNISKSDLSFKMIDICEHTEKEKFYRGTIWALQPQVIKRVGSFRYTVQITTIQADEVTSSNS